VLHFKVWIFRIARREFCNMKKLIIAALAAMTVALPSFAEKAYGIDDAVARVTKEVAAKLPPGTKVVVIDIKSASEIAGEYVADELTLNLLGAEKFVVVDRQSLQVIREELNFQMSGDVSDESAQRLGAMLGAETLITGSFDRLQDTYRLSVKAVRVETAELQYFNTVTVRDDDDVRVLFGMTTSAAAAAESRSSAASSVGSAIRGFFDFTGRFICMTVNPIFGIGSYMQGDPHGGGTVAFWEVAGGATFWVGTIMQNAEKEGGVLVTGAGGVMVVGAVAYSLIRPWTYNRAPKVAEALDRVNVEYVADEGLSVGFKLAY